MSNATYGRENPLQTVNYSHYTDRLKKPADALSELKSADNKFLFTRALLMEHGILPTTLDRPAKSDKSQEELIKLMAEMEIGFDLQIGGKYKEAAKQFSMILIDSEPGTEDHAQALFQRAMSLFQMGLYTQCLMDVRQAMGSKYPPEIGSILYKFAGLVHRHLGRPKEAKTCYVECLRRLNDSNLTSEQQNQFRSEVAIAMDRCKFREKKEETKEETYWSSDDSALGRPIVEKLVGGRNENIPALSAFLELKSSINMGRGVYATHDINPGDVVAIEKPYIYGGWLLHKACCHNCLKVPIFPIPCTNCSLVYYCSKTCMDKSMKDGHNFVCPIIFFIRSMPGITDLNELALKWLLKELSKMGLKKYCSLVDTYSKSQTDSMTRGFNDDGQYKSDNFLTAYSLDICEEKMSIDEMFFFNCIAAEILQYLMLSGFKIQECYLGIVGTSLVRILSILNLNCRQLNANAPSVASLINVERFPLKSKYYVTHPTALALYPSIGLFNHSCDANIKRSGKLSKKTRVMRAIQPIPKGRQLFFNYGRFFDNMKKETRQEICLDCFKFECCCQSCLENWPHYDSMPGGLSAMNILNPSMADTVIKECKRFEKFLNTVDRADYHLHLDYLNGFLKLLFTNVKLPFKKYYECLNVIDHIYTKLDYLTLG